MKYLSTIIWSLAYAFIFGFIVAQGVFYLYEREPTGLLFVLSVMTFAAIGYICFLIYATLKVTGEVEEELRYDMEMLEKKIEELEREQLVAKYPELK